MKKLLPLFILVSLVNAQDILTYVDNSRFKGKLIEVQDEYVVFMPVGSKESQTISKSRILSIRMGDGTVLNYADKVFWSSQFYMDNTATVKPTISEALGADEDERQNDVNNRPIIIGTLIIIGIVLYWY
ncbi:MAG: hypothetical protein NZ825_11680 [Candidatus Marinimicrobia bacterium]|nr:hypothetical protein [Candidatus Neomarinimicrobiota bacterium]